MPSNLQQVGKVSVRSLGWSFWLALIVMVAGSAGVFIGWQRLRFAEWPILSLASGIIAMLALGNAILLAGVYRVKQKLREDELYRSESALQEFSKIALDDEQDFRERLEQLLSVGCEFLMTEIGIFWKVVGNTLQIEAQAGGDRLQPGTSFALDETFAGEVVRQGKRASFRSTGESWCKDLAAVQPFPLAAYIGTPVLVSGRVTGILDFGSRDSRKVPFGRTHEAFLELIASWLGGELERQRQEKESRCLSFLVEFLPTCNTIEEALRFLTPKWDAFFLGSTGAVYLDRDGSGLPVASKWGEGASELPDVLQKNECWASHMNRQALSVREEFPCAHLAESSPGQYEHCCLPMMARGKTWGVLYLRFDPAVASPGRSASAVQERRLHLAAAVSEHLAISLANLDLREKLRMQAERDPLTRLFNRESLNHWLDSGAENQGGRLGIIMIDLDNFGRINKEVAHMAGDRVLAELGDFMRQVIREREDKVFRYGGEEFIVVLDGATVEVIRRRAEDIRQGFKSLHLSYKGEPLGPLSLSAGVAALPDHGGSRKSVLMAAEKALRRAKDDGKDRVTVATPGE